MAKLIIVNDYDEEINEEIKKFIQEYIDEESINIDKERKGNILRIHR
jgi:tRNA(Ser,Leu) C12 N-acetylase TAN1